MMEESPPTRSTRRVALHATWACNSQCRFCSQIELRQAQPGASACEPAWIQASQSAAPRASIQVTGGEPTLLPDLAARIEALRHARPEARIELVTNGRMLAYRRLTRRLVRAGVRSFRVALHGAGAAEHDWHVQVAGAFEQTLAGMREIQDAGARFSVTTVLTRANFRSAQSIVDLSLSWGASGWHARMPVPRHERDSTVLLLIPRLELLADPLQAALQRLESRRTPATVRGVPLCALGRHHAVGRVAPRPVHLGGPHRDALWRGDEEPARQWGASCGGCGLRAECSGMDARYVQRFGTSELVPVQPVQQTNEPAVASVEA